MEEKKTIVLVAEDVQQFNPCFYKAEVQKQQALLGNICFEIDYL